MKKILLMLLAFVTLSAVSQTTKKIYPYKPLAGVLKKGDGTYIKQELTSTSNIIQIGYNSSKNTWGRGYLEFDLSSIPKDATLTSAYLQIASASSTVNPNFNGKIQIYQTGLHRDANESIYNILGSTGIPILEHTFKSEGEGEGLTNDNLKQVIKSAFGSNLYLSIKHANESKIVNIAGENELLFLSVTYEGGSGGSSGGGSTWKPPTGTDGTYYITPRYVVTGQEFTLGWAPNASSHGTYEWTYDTNLFHAVGGTSGAQITLKAKQVFDITNTTVRLKTKTKIVFGIFTIYTTNKSWAFPIYGEPYIKELTICECENSLANYTIANLKGPYANSNTDWSSGPNTSIVSSQGALATFNVFGNNYATVKAKVTAGGKEFNLTNSEVWVGVPKRPIIRTNISEAAPVRPGNQYLFTGHIDGVNQEVTEYKWNNGKAYGKSAWLTAPTDGRSAFSVNLTVKNKCGWSPSTSRVFNVNYGGGSGGGFENPEIRINNTIQIIENENTEPYSVRIYDLSGKVVYTNSNITGELDLKSTSLYDGIYIIEKYDGKNITRDKVILKR